MPEYRFTFKSSEKLKSRKLIGQIFEKGQSFSHFPFRVVFTFIDINKSHLQAAFSVGTKSFKKAVDRNRIKRLMREAYRLQKEPLKNLLEQNQTYLTVFVIYTGKDLPDFDVVHSKMIDVIRRISEIAARKIENKKPQ